MNPLDLLRRRAPRWLPGWLAAVLLFAQVLTAAYACPQGGAEGLAAERVAMAAMPDCHGADGWDPQLPQLCKAHCAAGQQSFNGSAAAVVAAPALLDTPWAQRVLQSTDAAAPLGVQRSAVAVGPPRGTPPLYLTLLVLRD